MPGRPEKGKRTFLVGYDDSESTLRACRQAVKFAREKDLIVLLHISSPLPMFAREEKFRTMNEDRLQFGRELLQTTLSKMQEQGLNVEQLAYEGDPAHAIAEQAEKLEADLVIVGAGNSSSVNNKLLGGVTYSLLHETTLPILVVH